jgi:ADP-dependent NAD(P)H-hydrate dehydratase/NAD(P)H-hydrate epimerase
LSVPAAEFGAAQARAALPPRLADAHKHQSRLLLVAGSPAYLGAALLCARAAYRGGAGYVQVALPAELAASAALGLPEAVIAGLQGPEQLDTVLGLAAKAKAVVVGPGLGREPGTLALAAALWGRLPQCALFDADALAALEPGIPTAGPRILTPHAGELKRLLGPQALEQGREPAVHALAKAYGAIALLKGPGTLVATPQGRCARCASGTPALASAGTGDVLSGLIGALLAQGAPPFEAAALGAWLHGRSAELWAADNAQRGLLASDLIEHFPRALAEAGA